MSAPVSLRLWCMAAMAPALTETASQSRIKLPGSPPPDTNGSPSPGINGGEVVKDSHNHKVFDIASVSKIQGRPSLGTLPQVQNGHGPGRGLLTPINANGSSKSQAIYSVNGGNKLKKGFAELELISGLPDLSKTKPIPTVRGNGSKHSILFNKMNQPTSGPNGTGRRLKNHTIINGRDVNVNGIANMGYKTVQNAKGPMEEKKEAAKLPSGLSLVNKPTASIAVISDLKRVVQDRQPASVTVPVVDEMRPTSSSVVPPKQENPIQAQKSPLELAGEASKTQVKADRRCQFLLRRLRRLQGRKLDSHVKDQLSSFVSFQHQNLQTVATKAIKPQSKQDLFQTGDVKNLSTAALVNLVRKLQTTHPKLSLEQHLLNNTRKAETKGVLVMDNEVASASTRVAGQLKTNLAQWSSTVDSDATESSSGGESCDEGDSYKNIPKTALYKRAEWKWAVDRASIISRWTWLQAQVSDLEYRIRQQSEIHKTIRLSKGPVTLGEQPVTHDILTRLQASGIKPGQTDPTGLGERKVEVSPCNISTLLINVNRQATRLTQSLGNCLSPLVQQTSLTSEHVKSQSQKSLNGLIDGVHASTSSDSQSELQTSNFELSSPVATEDSSRTPGSIGPGGDCRSSATDSPDLTHPWDDTCRAARCRPVYSYRKRKLLRTAGLHQISRKASRLSTVKCQCYPPVMSCPMCGGRYNNFQELDPEGMPLAEKVSLLDPSYHPVLSFPQEIPLPVHFEALLKNGEWQTKPPPKTVRGLAAEKRRQKLLLKDQARKRKKLTKSAMAVLLTSKLRDKYERKSPRSKRLSTPKKKNAVEKRLRRKEFKRRRAAQLAIAALKRSTRELPHSMQDELDGDISSSSRTPTPSPQMKDGILSGSCSSAMLKELKDSWKKKRPENAYDINNIVIPYSMAAATRVEKLQYKEIQTPKWRDITLDEGLTTEGTPTEEAMDVEGEENEEEDISDEAFLQRHLKCEIQEKKRFMSFITYPPIRRSRISRDSESMSLDPWSPDPNLIEAQSQTAASSFEFQQNIAFRDELRRSRSGSTSSSRRSSVLVEDSNREFSTDISGQYRNLEPWDERTFPLSEEEYAEMRRVQEASMAHRVKRSYRRKKQVLEAGKEEIEEICGSRPPSPCPSSVSSTSSMVEDPKDPEWKIETELEDKLSQKSVILKLSRR